MKKITLFIALIMSMSLLTPALAQTRKEKKAAKKAQWEMQQQQAKEEAELLHQIRMDSIRQAEADRQQALKEEAMREKDVEIPCDDQSYSTLTNFRALGVAENMSMQVALIYASNNARAALAEQVKASVRSLTHNYVKSLNKNMTEDIELRFEQLTVTVVNQELQNSNPVCKEAKKFNRNGKLMYKYYVVMDMSKDALLQPLHQALSADDIANVDMDYNTFKVEFEKEFANQIETNVQ
ncbi:MAG: hypothetical protein IKA83_06500 [Paludibacteraceae bacterium]|nr:hypothetical protein [Paludibacteraceae bacterium]